jgi:hypothetical protein
VKHSSEHRRQQSLCLVVTRSSNAGRLRLWQMMVALVQDKASPKEAFFVVHSCACMKTKEQKTLYALCHAFVCACTNSHAFYAFYAWWIHFPQSGALAEGTSFPTSRKRDQA